jgi:hypothetical protein
MFPIGTRTIGNFEPDLLQNTAIVLADTFNFSARLWKPLAPLAYVKKALHNCFSAQGHIIFRAFLWWPARPLFRGRKPPPD